jgi:hypothetical protein
MKTTSVAEAMICAFSAIVETLPESSQHRINSILNAALSTKTVEDADAVRVLECLVEPRADEAASRLCQ